MARPRKCRKVCKLPERKEYGPLEPSLKESLVINMTVEEYETIRLIDLECYTQEKCAAQMNIARTTVQGIYVEARRKIAESIVNGRTLLIEGGDYKLCEGLEIECGGFGCNRHKMRY